MAKRTTPKPGQYDEKYKLPNGNYDYDAWLADYYAWGESQEPDPQDFSQSNPRPQRDQESNTGSNPGYPNTSGPGNGNDPDQIARGSQVVITPDPQPEAQTDAAAGKGDAPADKDRPWWETAADEVETATGQMMGATGEAMPDDWWGEVKNFRYADRKKLTDQYKTGVTDTDFREGVHQARQNRYETYAHGYDYADKDTPDDDHRSAANAAFFEDASWLDEIDTMDPEARKEYMRALQAADPESAQAILDDDRARRAGQR